MNDPSEQARLYLSDTIKAQQSINISDVSSAIELLLSVRSTGGTVFVAGNGGSAATASHAAVDFLKTSSTDHGVPTRALALADNVPVLTAIANDSDYADSFSDQIAWFGTKGDALLAISASGDSPNILAAAQIAKTKEMSVIALCGFGGGTLAQVADISIVVDSDDYGPVEDAHMMVVHLFTRVLRKTAPSK